MLTPTVTSFSWRFSQAPDSPLMESIDEDSDLCVDFWAESDVTKPFDALPGLLSLPDDFASLPDQSLCLDDALPAVTEDSNEETKQNPNQQDLDGIGSEETDDEIKMEDDALGTDDHVTRSADDRQMRRPTYDMRISKSCRELNIVNNPLLWTPDELKKWCDWALRQYHVHESGRELLLRNLRHNGMTFCQLQPHDLVNLFQKAGNYIYAELELWRNATEILSANAIHTNLPSFSLTSTSPVSTYSTSISSSSTASASSDQTSFDVTSRDSYATQSSLCTIPTFVLDTVLTDESFDDVKSTESSWFSSDSDSARFGQLRLPSDFDTTDSGSSLEDSCGSYSGLRDTLTYQADLSSPESWCPGGKQGNHLWQFLQELLHQPAIYENYIRWLDRQQGIFKIVDSLKVAKLWGERKNRPSMNYDKLSRSIRQYYKKGIIKKTNQSKRLVYQFCPRYIS